MLLLIAIRRPKLRIWPPPGIGSVQWLAVWGLTILAFGGIVAVGLEGGLGCAGRVDLRAGGSQRRARSSPSTDFPYMLIV